jgi:hypothetical protein
MIERNGSHDVPPPPELVEKLNTLGSAKSYLLEFQDIDPDDPQP